MMQIMNKVLIIAAHPDDDILGCGGLMSKYRGEVEFRVVFIAEGSSCRFNKKQILEEDVFPTRFFYLHHVHSSA